MEMKSSEVTTTESSNSIENAFVITPTVFVPLFSCTNYNDENPDKTKCIPLSNAETGGWGIAVAEGNTELVDELNAFIKDYYESGKLDELGEKYMPGKKEEFAKNGFQWFFDLEEQYK